MKAKYPQVRFTLADALGKNELFISQVVIRIEDAAEDIWDNTPPSPVPRDGIEALSMEIVEALLPPILQLSDEEKQVVKRIIHASGDPHIAPLVRFSPGAVERGVNALKKGTTIFTDVRMVAAGINKALAESSGCHVACVLDEAGNQPLPDKEITRSAAAIFDRAQELDDAVVVIGNAPTALMALLELVDTRNIRPALTVGMPVGFVQAKESKEALMKYNIPHITVKGTRGGSAMAAATVNALLKMVDVKKRGETGGPVKL